MTRPIALLTLLLLASASAAQTQWTPPAEIQQSTPSSDDKPKQKPVAAFGDDHPDCAEWTDGCIVCKRQEAGVPACSMPGVACLPAEPACVKSAASAPATQPESAHK